MQVSEKDVKLEGKENEEEIAFECMICRKIFKDPGFCPECQLILKKRGG